jgi:hypothetical protein
MRKPSTLFSRHHPPSGYPAKGRVATFPARGKENCVKSDSGFRRTDEANGDPVWEMDGFK